MAGSRFQGYGMGEDTASFVVIHCAVCHPGVPVSRAGRDYRALEVGVGRLVQRDLERSLVDFLTE